MKNSEKNALEFAYKLLEMFSHYTCTGQCAINKWSTMITINMQRAKIFVDENKSKPMLLFWQNDDTYI